MTSDTIEIALTLEPRGPLPADGPTALEVVDALLAQGLSTIVLAGPILEPGVALYVEDDVRILIDTYWYLEELLATPETFELHTYLGDGLVELGSSSDRSEVAIEVGYTPELDVAKRESWDLRLPEPAYVAWWRNLAASLIDFAGLG